MEWSALRTRIWNSSKEWKEFMNILWLKQIRNCFVTHSNGSHTFVIFFFFGSLMTWSRLIDNWETWDDREMYTMQKIPSPSSILRRCYHGFAGSVDSEFFFFVVLTGQPLLKLQPQTLRTHQHFFLHFFLFFFSVSLAPSLSAFFQTAVSAFYLSLRWFCLLFLHFPLILRFFPLHSRVF